MSELGKISGKLLNANLVRDGVDLTFRNNHSDPDFFYLNTTINNIGINTDNPLYDLDVSGRLETNNLNISSSLIIGNVSFNADSSISTTTGNLNIVPTAASPPLGGITVGPGTTLTSNTGDSVNLSKEFYSQELVDSLVGQIAVIDRYPAAPLFYTVVSIETEPFNSALWRMTVDATFDTTGWLKPISFYPDVELTQIITTDIWDTSGSSVGEKWVAWFKSNLPPNFETIVEPGWTINVAGTIYIVDYIIEDPINSNQWRIYVTTSLVAGTGIPIFSSPPPAGYYEAYISHDKLTTSALSIDGNFISAMLSNSNINFDPSGTGIVNLLEPTNITGNLHVQNSITLTGNVLIGGTITIGNEVLDNIQVTSDFGLSIIPSENNTFDLGNPTYNWSSVEVVTADVENLTQNSILIDNKIYLAPNGNDIRIIDSNSPLEIRSDTENIFLEALNFNVNEIENLRNTALTLTSTGIGYYLITDNNGFVIPVGTTSERVGNEVGETRWNSEIGWLECYDGSTWYVATGPGDFLSLEEMEGLGNLYSIILG